jgi:hypothetical protein
VASSTTVSCAEAITTRARPCLLLSGVRGMALAWSRAPLLWCGNRRHSSASLDAGK